MKSAGSGVRWFPVFVCAVFLAVAPSAIHFPAAAIAAQYAQLRGIITDQATTLPIEAVEVTAWDSAGDRTYSAATDPFGMFIMDGMEPGTYTLEAHHPGYVTGSLPDFSVTLDGRNQWRKDLVLKEPFIDIFVEVSCVTTGMKLKNVPVRITAAPTGGGSAVERTGTTDALGFVRFTGLPAGGYSFSVNEGEDKIPGWESYSENVGKELTGPHWADVLLKAETRQITATVYGYNPVTEEDNVPLEGIVVECEGVHPDDPAWIMWTPLRTWTTR